jgi:hypothetical protein
MDPELRRRARAHRWPRKLEREDVMNNIVWIVGAVVIVVFVLGFLGIR